MPTPVVYTELGKGPVDHVPESERFTNRRVYYATTRTRTTDMRRVDYGNKLSDQVSVGLSLIGFGSPSLSWEALQEVVSRREREESVVLTVNGVVEAGGFDPAGTTEEIVETTGVGWWMHDLNDSIGDARDKDLMIYVHGAKVDFYNGNAFAAQIDHFMGRDMTSLAFCWPTHQDIFHYAFGSDMERGRASAESLARLLEVLAEKSAARRIHIVAWSAGARVLTQALASLHDRQAPLLSEGASLREKLRLGTVYFVAGDVERDLFLDSIGRISSLSERVIVSASSNDIALINAKFFMGGQTRIGQKDGSMTAEEAEMIEGLGNVMALDVSLGAETRGFDITGHEYWFTNPWASTDVVLAVRTDLGPAERGLVQSKYGFVWALPADYPERLRDLPPREMLRREE
ncbi:alpha/beta hydrolase [Mucisphaera calidilacus]|nr:alpha/beta hydrolase [Mucisphaera calidilacus]